MRNQRRVWLLDTSSLPPDDQLDVRDVPRTSGKLSARELEITELDEVDVLLARLADRTYTALEVATAFCRRATLAHQLVRPFELLMETLTMDRPTA